MNGNSVSRDAMSLEPQTTMYSNYYSKGLTRSRSAMPIREVRDQMEDLKGRISSLQQRAKAETLKRRSLQSLRTPSPFTAAEQWYLGGGGVIEGSGGALSADAAVRNSENRWNSVLAHPSQDNAVHTDGTAQPEDMPNGRVNGDVLTNGLGEIQAEETDRGIFEPVPDPIAGAVHTIPEEAEVVEEEVEDQGKHISEEVVEEEEEEEEADDPTLETDSAATEDGDFYQDALPVPERHEDRPDAFDYEHFFLHSAMGNYSQTDVGRRDSYASNDSTASADTARPTAAAAARELHDRHDDDDDDGGDDGDDNVTPRKRAAMPHHHERSVSVESLSTVATFATATEGESAQWEHDRWGESVKAIPGSFPIANGVERRALPPHPSSSSFSPPAVATTTTRWNPDVSHTPRSIPDHHIHHQNQLSSPTTTRRRYGFVDIEPDDNNNSSPCSSSSSSWPLPEPSSSPLSALLSTLKPTSSSFSSSHPPLSLAPEDRQLLERLLESVQRVYIQLQQHQGGGGGGGDGAGGFSNNEQHQRQGQAQEVSRAQDRSRWRSRLVEAGRILDGN